MADESYWIQPTSTIPKRDIELPPADQIGNRVMVPFLTCYRLDDDFSGEKFTRRIKAATAATLAEMPFLAGRVAWASKPESRLKINFPESPTVLLRINHVPRLDASELKAGFWPLHALIASELCPPLEHWNYIGACFCIQANLIKGGVILAHLINHVIADGITMMDVLRVFGRHMKRFASEHPAPPVETIESAALLRSLAWGTSTKKTLADWQDFRPLDPQDVVENGDGLMPTKPEGLGVSIWHISPGDMQRLRADVVASCPQDAKLSFTCCLSAFLWRILTRARRLHEATLTTFLLSIQVRKRVEPPLPGEYCGNALVYSRAKASVAELSSQSLADLGLRIKTSIDWWTPERIREYWGSVESCQNLNLYTQNWDRDGVDLELSSLMNSPYWDTASGDEQQIPATRMPAFPFTDGFVQVLPRLSSGGVEVVLHLAKSTLKQAVDDVEFHKYMQYRCGTDPDFCLPSIV